MKNLWVVLLIAGIPNLYAAETMDTSLKLKGTPTDGDTSIMIKKGPLPNLKEKRYEIISETQEVLGDPGPDREAYANWKTACADWKKEIKELNNTADSKVVSANCGTPSSSRSPEMVYRYQSKGTYKVRILMVEPVNTK